MAQTIANLQVNGLNPVSVGGTGIARKVFPFVPGASIGATSTSDGIIWVPGSGRANGQLMKVVAGGDYQVGPGGACPNITIDLLANTAAIGKTPSYTTIATSGLVPTQQLTGTLYPWYLEVTLQGTTGSGVVQGTQKFQTDNTLQSASVVVLTANLSAINFTTEAPFGLAVGVTYSVSEPLNKANMYQFELQI